VEGTTLLEFLLLAADVLPPEICAFSGSLILLSLSLSFSLSLIIFALAGEASDTALF